MAGKATITINGRLYDATSGLPVDSIHTPAVPVPTKRPVAPVTTAKPHRIIVQQDIVPSRTQAPATAVHSRPERSQTLRRTALKKPEATYAPPLERQRAHMTRSPQISKFTQAAPTASQPTVAIQPNDAPQKPVVQRTYQRVSQVASQNRMPISSRTIKEHLVNAELAKKPEKRVAAEKRFFTKHPRMLSVASAGLAIVLLGGYLTYINVPNLSMRVAAAQAGINATLPEYQPDGYSFDGPPQYAQGQVTIRYASNTSPQGYTITQKASDWDSQAILDNYVAKASNGAYNIHSVQGLTIYTFNNKAAWVSSGLMHEVDFGKAPLSYNQIEQIAASM